MSPEKWAGTLLLLLIISFSAVSGGFVGVNIGMDLSSSPSAEDIAALLRSEGVTHVRLFDADRKLLAALAGTGIQVTVGIPNTELLRIGQSPSAAAAWVNLNVAAQLPDTNITAIAVGSEVLTSLPNAALILVPALTNIHAALVASALDSQIKVSSPQSMDIVVQFFPPSTASFNRSILPVLSLLLNFLEKTEAPFMLNAYPYYAYSDAKGIYPLEFALFRDLPPAQRIVDPNSDLPYDNLLDAMIDAVYHSMEALNHTHTPIILTESGWPHGGDSSELDATPGNAIIYNTNLINHVRGGGGTPGRPESEVSVFVYEMFDEDLRPGPMSEKSLGVIYPNLTAIYPLQLGSGGALAANPSSALGVSGLYCVATPGADALALKTGLDWACGPGLANCTALQEGQPCYNPNTLENHASYAYNDYYQRSSSSGGTCNFNGTATTTSIDPSYGTCVFTGSSKSSGGGGSSGGGVLGPTTSPGGLSNGSPPRIRVSRSAFLVTFFLALFHHCY
ncbi:hypothetical protein AMTRI_Chr03g140710 [Amborella trichopoda]